MKMKFKQFKQKKLFLIMNSDSAKINVLSQKLFERVLTEIDNNSEDIQIKLNINRDELKAHLINILNDKDIVNNILI